MKLKVVIVVVALLLSTGVWYLFQTPPKHYSRTAPEAMRNLEIAVNTNDPNKVFELFAYVETFDYFMRLSVDSEIHEEPTNTLVRHKGQSVLGAWQQWFKKFGLSTVVCDRALSGDGFVCTTKGDMNFMLFIKYLDDKGYLITDCSYALP